MYVGVLLCPPRSSSLSAPRKVMANCRLLLWLQLQLSRTKDSSKTTSKKKDPSSSSSSNLAGSGGSSDKKSTGSNGSGANEGGDKTPNHKSSNKDHASSAAQQVASGTGSSSSPSSSLANLHQQVSNASSPTGGPRMVAPSVVISPSVATVRLPHPFRGNHSAVPLLTRESIMSVASTATGCHGNHAQRSSSA